MADEIKVAAFEEIRIKVAGMFETGPAGSGSYAAGMTVAVPTFTDNGGGNVTIGGGYARLFENATFTGIPIVYPIAEATFDLPADQTVYIVANYNAGVPEYQAITDVSLINESWIIPVFTVVIIGGQAHHIDWDLLADGLANKIHARLVKTERFARESGLLASEGVGRILKISAGRIWTGAADHDLQAFSSDVDQANFFRFYHAAGVWTYDLSPTPGYNNTHYDDGTDLVEAAPNRYIVNWIFRDIDDAPHTGIVIGGQHPNLASAIEEAVPALPDYIRSNGFLVGRIIIQKNAAVATRIDSTFTTAFNFAGVGDHEDLSGLLGGATGEHYHLTAAQHAAAVELPGILTDTKDPTGFVNNAGVIVNYDPVARTVTLTGDLRYRYNGFEYTLAAPWTSPAHDAGDGVFFLYATDGSDDANFQWSETVWPFSAVQMAVAVVSGADAFALREPHGTMPWQAHEESHDLLGTYRVSGLGPTSGTYTLNTTSDDATRPGFDAGVIKDEDILTSILDTAENLYTTLRIGAGGVPTYDTAATFPFRSSGSFILINDPSDGSETVATNNRYVNVYELLVPVAADATSQKYRRLLVQPQAQFLSLEGAQSEDVGSLSLGLFNSPEFVFRSRLTYRTNNGYANTGKVQLVGISVLTGSRVSQSNVVGGAAPTAENIPFSPTNNISATDVQAAIQESASQLKGYTEPDGTVSFVAGAAATDFASVFLNFFKLTLTEDSAWTLSNLPENYPVSARVAHTGGPWVLTINGTSVALEGAAGEVEYISFVKIGAAIEVYRAGVVNVTI